MNTKFSSLAQVLPSALVLNMFPGSQDPTLNIKHSPFCNSIKKTWQDSWLMTLEHFQKEFRKVKSPQWSLWSKELLPAAGCVNIFPDPDTAEFFSLPFSSIHCHVAAVNTSNKLASFIQNAFQYTQLKGVWRTWPLPEIAFTREKSNPAVFIFSRSRSSAWSCKPLLNQSPSKHNWIMNWCATNNIINKKIFYITPILCI